MCNFFELARGLLGPMKDALLMASGKNVSANKTSGDHCYQANDPTTS